NEDEFPAFAAKTDAVANHALAEHSGKFRREIAHLVGVREEHEVRLGGFDDLLERGAKTVGSVGVEYVVLDEEHFSDVLGGDFHGKRGYTFANDRGANRARSSRGNLLRRYERLKTGVVPFALALFGNDEDFHG